MMELQKSQTFFLGLQHVLAMYAGAVIVPIIVGSSLGLDTMQIAYLIGADLLTSGIATLLQVWRNRFFGIGLPVVLGCTFTAVFPMIAIGKELGMGAIYGAIITSGLIVFLISHWFGKLVRFFPPVVTGSIVTVIGVTLVPVAMNNLAGGQGSPDFGSVLNLTLGFLVLAFILILNRVFKGYIQAISVLLGLVFGTLLALCLGLVDLTPVMEASWAHIPQPFYFGLPTFHASAILTMTIVAMVSMVESTGVFLALGEICERKLTPKDLAHGYRAEGLASIIGGIFNSFPYTTFSQNVGLVELSKVRNSIVIVVCGILLVILGLVPKFAALATIIPTPVLGGAMVAMFGMVCSAGIRMLGKADFNDSNTMLIAACSITLGLGVTVTPNLFAQFPSAIRILLESGIVVGALTAVVLNILFNYDKIRRNEM
ncbi:nucleobase:cation symporter-2 family protein [Veillonella intestinalis]|uniref:nucleobase:cation symporter-2 family protein n=2 Tax=Veillonella intestinalis TaxID=2941341 RepID=UPI00240793E2|nr:nucleobase:cation symporter-2 family protein [Veillonella intestinalis]